MHFNNTDDILGWLCSLGYTLIIWLVGWLQLKKPHEITLKAKKTKFYEILYLVTW